MRKITKAVLIPVSLLLLANGAVATVPTVREAIEGLPLQDQIFFIANEIDEIKREQACHRAELARIKALEVSGIIDADTANDLEARRQQMIKHKLEWRLKDFDPFYNQYLSEQEKCLAE